MFTALVVEKDGTGQVAASIQELPDDVLPPGDVTVAVEYSTLNYKDGMCLATGNRLVRQYPHDHGLKPEKGEVLVTGAAGGVGSVAVALLARLGFKVAAVTGRPDTEDYLRDLGATRIIPRADLAETVKQPLESETWAGAIDTVGGAMLARVLGQMQYGASVAALGMAGGVPLPATVIPFILRGVNLLGIDSVMRPYEDRTRAWNRLAHDLPMDKLEAMIRPATLADLPELGAAILKGQVQGRVVVDTRA